MSTRDKGKEKEKVAERFLRKKGYKIIERNYTKRTGEIDIIAKKDNTLIFVEVRSLEKGSIDPIETINLKKRQKIIKTAKMYLLEHPEFAEYDIRFDFVGIHNDEIKHIENAFWEEV